MYHQPVQDELPLIIIVELVRDSSFLSSRMTGAFATHMHQCPLGSPPERSVQKLFKSIAEQHSGDKIFHSSI